MGIRLIREIGRGTGRAVFASGITPELAKSERGPQKVSVIRPNIVLVAHTCLNDAGVKNLPWERSSESDTDADALADFAGRACYQSFHRPNPKTAANADYIANIIRQSHFSVLEHASATFYLTGVSRALLTELSRHRHLSLSVVSQRFVDSTNAPAVIPPALRDDPQAVEALEKWQETVGGTYALMVEDLQSKGVKRKQAREAARCLMPNMTETKIVVTGSMAAWRYVIGRRIDPSADAEIREVAGMILAELKKLAPNSFADFEEHNG